MNPGRTFFGLALLSIGVLFLLEQADVLDAGDAFGTWWPALIVILGTLQYLADRSAPVPSLLLVGVGIVLLGATAGVLDGDVWRFVWPVVVIGAGAWIAFGRPRLVGRRDEQDAVNSVVAFWSRRLVSRSPAFTGGSVSVFFGSVELDLREARPAPSGAKLGATVVFSSLEVTVPEGWQVTIRGIPFFGSWDDTTRRDVTGAGAPTLAINALVVFGGLEVRHGERWSQTPA